MYLSSVLGSGPPFALGRIRGWNAKLNGQVDGRVHCKGKWDGGELKREVSEGERNGMNVWESFDVAVP